MSCHSNKCIKSHWSIKVWYHKRRKCADYRKHNTKESNTLFSPLVTHNAFLRQPDKQKFYKTKMQNNTFKPRFDINNAANTIFTSKYVHCNVQGKSVNVKLSHRMTSESKFQCCCIYFYIFRHVAPLVYFTAKLSMSCQIWDGMYSV